MQNANSDGPMRFVPSSGGSEIARQDEASTSNFPNKKISPVLQSATVSKTGASNKPQSNLKISPNTSATIYLERFHEDFSEM
jgi:hypothetical protein